MELRGGEQDGVWCATRDHESSRTGNGNPETGIRKWETGIRNRGFGNGNSESGIGNSEMGNGNPESGNGKREFGIGDSESGIGRGTRPACPQSGMNCECCQCESVANPNSQLPISDSTPMAHKGASLPLRLGFAAVSRMGFDALRATRKFTNEIGKRETEIRNWHDINCASDVRS